MGQVVPGSDVVVWLDDLRVTQTPGALAALLRPLLERRRVLVAATTWPPPTGERTELDELVDIGAAVITVDEEWTESELRAGRRRRRHHRRPPRAPALAHRPQLRQLRRTPPDPTPSTHQPSIGDSPGSKPTSTRTTCSRPTTRSHRRQPRHTRMTWSDVVAIRRTYPANGELVRADLFRHGESHDARHRESGRPGLCRRR